jgi:hypothetical protein
MRTTTVTDVRTALASARTMRHYRAAKALAARLDAAGQLAVVDALIDTRARLEARRALVA